MTPELTGPANADLIRSMSILLPVLSLTLAVFLGWRKYVSRDETALQGIFEKIRTFFWGDKVLSENTVSDDEPTSPEPASTTPQPPQWLDMELYGPSTTEA